MIIISLILNLVVVVVVVVEFIASIIDMHYSDYIIIVQNYCQTII